MTLGTVRCPTCRAVQEWSATCRRCQSDLRLLRDAATAYDRGRRDWLTSLRAGQPRAALRAADRCHALIPDADSRRMRAVAALLAEACPEDSPQRHKDTKERWEES